MNEKILRAQLELDEGNRARIYVDTVGKVSGGIGRNLTDRGFSADEIDLMYANDIKLVLAELDKRWPWWRELNDPRQHVMINMCFNLGAGRLSGFKIFLADVQAKKWVQAAEDMLFSKWAEQVGRRATRLAELMRTGEF